MAIKVFIDTNIYEGANFSFYNKQFSKLKELTEEESVELLYNEIIYQEVYQHIEENLTKAVSEYNKVIEGNRASIIYLGVSASQSQIMLQVPINDLQAT